MIADSPPSSLAFADSAQVRDYLVEAPKLDLVGPGAGHDLADELLHGWRRPSTWYLTGFLIPSDTPFEDRSDVDEDDSLDEVPDTAGLVEESADNEAWFPPEIPRPALRPTSSACGSCYRPVGQRCSRASSTHQPLLRSTPWQWTQPGDPSTLVTNVEPSASSSA